MPRAPIGGWGAAGRARVYMTPPRPACFTVCSSRGRVPSIQCMVCMLRMSGHHALTPNTGPRMRRASCRSLGTERREDVGSAIRHGGAHCVRAAGQALTDGDALGVDGAQVAVLEQVHHEVLHGLQTADSACELSRDGGLAQPTPETHLLQCQQRLRRPPERLRRQVVCNLADLGGRGAEASNCERPPPPSPVPQHTASRVSQAGGGGQCRRLRRTRRANGSLRTSRSVLFWNLRISFSARVPGRYRNGFRVLATPPAGVAAAAAAAPAAGGAKRQVSGPAMGRAAADKEHSAGRHNSEAPSTQDCPARAAAGAVSLTWLLLGRFLGRHLARGGQSGTSQAPASPPARAPPTRRSVRAR